MKAAEEGCVVYGFEGLEKVHGHRHRSPWRTVLVEPRGYFIAGLYYWSINRNLFILIVGVFNSNAVATSKIFKSFYI